MKSLVAAALIAMAGCAATPRPMQPEVTQVLVVRRGWHIDVGFAATDIAAPLENVSRLFPRARYLFFGFGDERYIRSSVHRLPATLAAVWPGRGVMLVTAIDNEPLEAFGAGNTVSISLSAPALLQLQRFIWRSFSASRAEPAVALKAGPYEGSLYFSADRNYSGVHTCNTWAAEALKAGEIPVHSTGVVFAWQLWKQVRSLAPRAARATVR